MALTSIIVGAIATAALTAAATAYNATDGFGAGIKVKSSLDIQKERLTVKNQIQGNTTESNGRHFVQRQKNLATQATKPTQAIKPTQATQPTLPTIATLPTLPTGQYWQEYDPTQANITVKSTPTQIISDVHDTEANRGVYSTLVNTISETADKYHTLAPIVSPVLAAPAAAIWSIVDNVIWNIGGDKHDSMLKNIFVDPWVDSNLDVGGALVGTVVNALNGIVEVVDILANPIKGIAAEGSQGFFNAFGLSDNGYVVYEWDTDSVVLDVIAETLSDPLFFIDVAKGVVNLTKLGAKKTIDTATKATIQDFISNLSSNVSKTEIVTLLADGSDTVTNLGKAYLKTADLNLATDIIIDQVTKGSRKNALKQAGKAIAHGNIELIDAVNKVYKATDDVQAKLYNDLLMGTLNDMRKAGLKVVDDPSLVAKISNAVTELYKKIDLDKMTAQIMATKGLIGKQNFLRVLDNIPWLSQAFKDFDKLQGVLGKVALYGTAPAIPLLGKALSNTDLGQLLKRGTNGLFELLIAKITNDTAYQFTKAVAKASGEHTIESYAVLRNAYVGASEVVHDTLLTEVKFGTEQAIQANLTAPQIGAQAFQRNYAQRFSRDSNYYRALIKKGAQEADIDTAWESYIKRNYNMSSKDYVVYLTNLNELEKRVTGAGVYGNYLARINHYDRLRENTRLRSFLKNPNSAAKINGLQLTQGRALSAEEILSLDPNITIYKSMEEYNKHVTNLIEEQAFIQTQNKVIINNDLHKIFNPLYTAYKDSDGTKGLLAELSKLNNGDASSSVSNIIRQLDYADRTHTQLLMFVEDVKLYAPLPKGIPEKALATAMMDAFMGLNNKITRFDSSEHIAREMAAIVELQLSQRYGKLDGFVKGLLTNDKAYIKNLTTSIESYMGTLPEFGPLVFEYSTAAKELEHLRYRLENPERQLNYYTEKYNNDMAASYNLKRKEAITQRYNDHIQAIKVAYPDYFDETVGYSKYLQQVKELIDNIKYETTRTSEMVIVLKTELARSGLDNSFTGSIHDALAKAAGEDFAGTLYKIADGYNVTKMFPNIDVNELYNVATVNEVQEMANKSMEIYNRIYLSIADDKTTQLVERAWDTLLKNIVEGPTAVKDPSRYLTDLIDIMSAQTQELNTTQKYSILMYIYNSGKYGKQSAELNTLQLNLRNLLNFEAYADLVADFKNIRLRTNAPNFNGSGLDWTRANNLYATPANQQILSDMRVIHAERDKIVRSLTSLEEQIKNVSNADPILFSHIQQNRALLDFYDNRLKHYQKLINESIDTGAMYLNLNNATLPSANRWFEAEDIETMRDIYSGVVDVAPEKITRLNKRVEEYNRGVIGDLSFAQGSMTDEQFERYISTFRELILKDDLSDTELARLVKQYPELVKYYTPNAVKKKYAEYLARNREFKLHLSDTVSGGVFSETNKTITIGLSEVTGYDDHFYYALKHETVHARLSLTNDSTRQRTVETFWNHLLKGPNKEFAEDFYTVTWYRYFKDKGVDGYYFNSDIFDFNNIAIKEEIMCNILAADKDSVKHLQNNLKGYLNKVADMDLPIKLDPTNLPKFNYDDPDTLNLIDTYYKAAMDDAFVNGLSLDQTVVYWHDGARIDLEAPFKKVDDIMLDFKHTDRQRLSTMMQSRLSQEPLEFAKDLARTGPFQFYSIKDIKNTKGDYSLHKYFDADFNLRADRLEELQQYGVNAVVLPDQDTVMFYIDKSRVGFDRNHSYFDGQLITYDYHEHLHTGAKYDILNNTSQTFSDASYRISGQALGYSDGWRLDKSFLTTLFKGTKDGVNPNFPSWPGLENLDIDLKGWALEDFLQPKYYPVLRFNEMLMGGSTFKRRFGVYQSANPIINMSNALQQMHTLNKVKTEMTLMLYDDMLSIATGVFSGYSNEDIYQTYLNHPEYVFVTMTGKTKDGELIEQTTSKFTKFWLGDSWNPVRVQEFIPFNATDIQKAREMGARFMPRSYFNMLYNTLNNRIGSDGVLEWVNKHNYIYKFFALAFNPMTYVRNAIDTYGKNTIALKDEMPKWTAYAWTLKKDYQEVSKVLKQHGIVGDKAIREFFDTGAVKAYTKTDFTYQMFKDLRDYENWGPSTGGLKEMLLSGVARPTAAKADSILDSATRTALELSDDELMRIAARDVVPGYGGLWETFVEKTSQIFDIGNITFGAQAEKVNRLALYLKAISEGQTKQQAFQWITKIHFDYSIRPLYEQVLETMMPFITFTLKNLQYWLDAIATEPWVVKYLMNYYQAMFAYYDFTPEQMAASKQWQNMVLSGNIPLNKRPDDVTTYFKLSASFADAFNTFINPIEVFKERLIFPTRAIEKSFTEDYKGQSLMGKQPVWNQVLDWTASLPGNALARRITNAVKREDTLSVISELLGATGQTTVKPPRVYGNAYTPRMRFVFNRQGTKPNLKAYGYKLPKYSKAKPIAYAKRLPKYYTTRAYINRLPNLNSANYNQRMDSYTRTQVTNYKSAKGTRLSQALVNTKKPLGQRLTENLYLKKYPMNVSMIKSNRNNRRVWSMTQYKVQRALFSR